jgi:Cytochrome c
MGEPGMSRWRWGVWKLLALGAALGVVGALTARDLASAAAYRRRAEAAAKVERGRRLVHTHGCNDCHTPMKAGLRGPERDSSRMLSGHPASAPLPVAPALEGPWVTAGSATGTAFAGPWGVTFTANLTPDANTGLGIWSEEMFVEAMRTGRHFGASRPIQPPMPWKSFARMTDGELKAIYAYLRTIPPVTNPVPDYQPRACSAVEK